ncbi:hypothetical protein D3C87_393040 [compost metagenome]
MIAFNLTNVDWMTKPIALIAVEIPQQALDKAGPRGIATESRFPAPQKHTGFTYL